MNSTKKYIEFLESLAKAYPEKSTLVEAAKNGFHLCFESNTDKYSEFRTHGTVNGDDLPEAPRVRERRPSEMWRTRMGQHSCLPTFTDDPSANRRWKYADEANIDDDIQHTHYEELAQQNRNAHCGNDDGAPTLSRKYSDVPYSLEEKYNDESDNLDVDAYEKNPHFVKDTSQYANR